MDHDFRDRVALVTGAATGIGRACADLLSERGARVIYSDRDLPRATVAAQGKGEPLHLDVADREGVGSAVAAALARHGRIDVLVNNAGIGVRAEDRATIDSFPEAAWDEVLAVDLTGLFLVSKAVLPGMKARRAGVVVNIASITGIVPLRLQSPYIAAKAAVINLTRAMAIELAADGIRVNAVAPGSCATEAWQEWMDNPLSQAGGLHEKQMATIPMRRPGTPREMAEGVAFLASSAASYITGHTLVIDGGWTAGYARDW
jgi:NAD(P)-dependent dehydrogenase (short-subunit alcohol dehydrogenase family)